MSLVMFPDPGSKSVPSDQSISCCASASRTKSAERSAGNAQRITALGEMTTGIAHDTGQGMPLDVARRFFDPFFTTNGKSGTGLGVPQVCAFVKAAGGYLCIDSQVGEGTAVDLFFPVSDKRVPSSVSLWRQLDRWVNEGRRAGDGAPPSPSAA